MADIASAHPGTVSAPQQTRGMGMCDLVNLRLSQAKRWTPRALSLAATAHLLVLAMMEFGPGGQHPPMLLILSGVLLTILALLHHDTPAVSAAVPLRALSDAEPSRPLMIAAPSHTSDFGHAREIVLERQSQRLVEIADAATRARRESECRSKTWADLMAQVSHELRTPLNAVIGFSDAMTAELFGPVGHPRYREYVDHIRDSGRALLKSTEDTLALTTLLAGPSSRDRATSLSFDEIAAEAWSFFAGETLAREIGLSRETPAGLEVLGERRLLRQILINLFTEAVSRTRDGGSVRLIARCDGDVVQLQVTAGMSHHVRPAGEASLAICLARTMLELQGAFLIESVEESDDWRAITVLSRSTQADFFASIPSPCSAHVYVC